MKRSRTYTSPLRAQQAQATRERILAAVADILARGGLADMSFRAIAEAAGVTEITVYRHFPDKPTLLRSFWQWLDAQMTDRGMPRTEAALVHEVQPLFEAFDARESLIRAAILTAEGRQMRMSVQPERAAAFTEALREATLGLPEGERRQAHAVVQLLFSAHAWLSMKEHWGLTGTESGAAAAWAIRVLLDHLHHRRRAGARHKERKS